MIPAGKTLYGDFSAQQSPQTLATISHRGTCRPAHTQKSTKLQQQLFVFTNQKKGEAASKYIEGCRLAQKPQ